MRGKKGESIIIVVQFFTNLIIQGLSNIYKVNFSNDRLKFVLDNCDDQQVRLKIIENMRTKLSSTKFLELTRTYLTDETIDQNGSRGFKYQYHRLCNRNSDVDANDVS